MWKKRPELTVLQDIPEMSAGAPLPVLLQSEGICCLAYLCNTRSPDWDGRSVRVVSHDTEDEPVAIVAFKGVAATYFGRPNDEALRGHPLYDRGLKPYSAFDVANSEWIASLERMNRVHRNHKAEHFRDFRHYVFTFHDSTFECVADSYAVELTTGSISGALARMRALAAL
jgi:hypothetical protein